MDFEKNYKNIFDANQNSPLFTRVATDAIANGLFDDAVNILKIGIEKFEDYPTPYFLLGDLYLKLDKIEEAKKTFEIGSRLLNNDETLNYYLSKINIQNNEDPFEVLQQLTKQDDDIVHEEREEENHQIENSVEENLDELADKLKTAKIVVKDTISKSNSNPDIEEENPKEFKPLKGLVSETLASIYFNQSNYKEAKAIYETLIDIQPERADYFKSKIAEVESKMSPRS